MSRKKSDNEELVKVPGVRVPADVMERIEKIVAKIPGMSRSQFCSNLLLVGLEDAEMLDGLGIYSSMEYIRGTLELIKKTASSVIKGIA